MEKERDVLIYKGKGVASKGKGEANKGNKQHKGKRVNDRKHWNRLKKRAEEKEERGMRGQGTADNNKNHDDKWTKTFV